MRKTKVEKGITLVALIITIIVLLILAVVAINAVQNDGIIEYAKNARTQYEKAQEEEQDTLDYYLSQIETTKGIHNGTIPKDGSYTRGEESFGEGEKFPETPVEGDEYICGDYKYIYSDNYSTINDRITWEFNDQMNGWYVNVLDKSKTKYGEILTTINGADVKSIGGTFVNCTSLEVTPTIPNTIVDMRYAFQQCNKLVVVTNIPNGVIDMNAAFNACTDLFKVPSIPDSVIKMENTFRECTSLEIAPTISNHVTNLGATFDSCTNLKSIPDIPSSVNNMMQTFWGCRSLPDTITIKSENVTVYKNCFYDSASASGNKIALKGIDNNGDKEWDNKNVLENLAGTAANIEIFDLNGQG